ncbi:MAG: hypothetical protein QXP44_04910, partial [Candidatus Bathyarchaeia archaeon]
MIRSFSRAVVSHVTYHLTSQWSGALLSAKLSRRGMFVPAPTVSHVWVNPPSQAASFVRLAVFRWVRRHGVNQWDTIIRKNKELSIA